MYGNANFSKYFKIIYTKMEKKRISESLIQKYCCESTYNKCFFNAKEYTEHGENPSLVLITIFFLVGLYKTFDWKIAPTEADLNKIILKCKGVNNLKICMLPNGTWDKTEYFNLVKEIIQLFISLSSEKRFFDDADSFETYVLKDGFMKQKKPKNKYPMFDDAVGLEKAKEAIKMRVIDPSLHREFFDKYDVQVGGGILLFGLPGTGKTMFAQAVANEINGHFINVKSSDVKSKWFGETENRIKEIFDEAQEFDVSVIFFDEFEAIGVSRDKQGSEITASSVVPELLNQLQGFQKRENIVLVIAATNRPWDIDSALLRPGRLETLVYVDLPNVEARRLMFSKLLKKIKAESDIIEYLASKTEGYNGSDIKEISDKLIRVVIEKEINGIPNYEITFEDCVHALQNTKSSVSLRDKENMAAFMRTHKTTK